MKSTSARKASSAKTAYRGSLSRRQWDDLRQAARLARACGAGFILHGVQVVPPGDVHRGRKIPERTDGEKKKMPVPDAHESESKDTGDEARANTSKRQQKSAQRREEWREKKRDEERGACWLSIVQHLLHRDRKKLCDEVWTAWMPVYIAQKEEKEEEEKQLALAVSLSLENKMDPVPTTPDIGAQRAEDGPSSKKKATKKKKSNK